MVLVSISSGNRYPRNCFHSCHLFTMKSSFKVHASVTPLKVGRVLGLVSDDVKIGVQSDLFNTDTEGTQLSVRIMEVSVL